MRPSHPIRHILLAAATTLGVTVALAPPASAAHTITATSVALSANSSCDSPSGLDLGMVADEVHSNTGIASTTGSTLTAFAGESFLSGFSGVLSGFGFGFPPWSLPEGSLVGLYVSVGDIKPNAANTAEWFVLYRCGSEGNTVLQSCYGPLGTCPTTVDEALIPRPTLTLDPSATTEPPTTEAPPTTAGPTTMVPSTTAIPGTTGTTAAPNPNPGVRPATGARPRSGKPSYTG